MPKSVHVHVKNFTCIVSIIHVNNLFGSTLHVDNKTIQQYAFKLTSIWMQNIWTRKLESPREFELIQRNFIFRFSIGSKGARDDGSHFVGDW